MLSNAAVQPMQPSRFLAMLSGLFHTSKFGSATYSVGAGRQLIHEQTQLSYQPLNRETPESFIDRVRSDGEEGDVIEYGIRDGKIVTGTITRRAAVQIKMEANETLAAFVIRLQAYKKTLPQA